MYTRKNRLVASDVFGNGLFFFKFLCRLQRAFTSGAIAIDCKGGHRFRVSIFLKVAVGWWCQWGRFIRNSLRTSLSDATPGKRLIELPGL